MSSRLMLTRAAAMRPSFVAGQQVLLRRTIARSSHLEHKESTSHQPDPEIDKHKMDLLKKQKEGKAHWKPELASDSEEAVKADRSGPKESSADAMKNLQERTKRAAEETSKSGTSMQDGL